MTEMANGLENINGNQIYYEYYKENPSRPTILFIHGFLSSSFSFRKLYPLLKNEYNLISVDLPPFGKSGKSLKYVYSNENNASSVISLLEKLGIEKVAVIGHSMGGQIGLRIAGKRPNLTEKAILLSSSGYLKPLKKSLALLSYLPAFHRYVKNYLKKSGVMKNLQLVVHDQSIIDDEMYKGYLEPFLDDGIFKALGRMARHWEGDLPKEKLQKIHTPCLLIWGKHDRVVPVSVGEKLHRDLPNSKLIVLKETGHLVPEEKPEEVFRHIQNFLQN